MAWAVFNTENAKRVTKAHSTKIAALIEAFEAGMVMQGGAPDFIGDARQGLFLIKPYAVVECDSNGFVVDYDPITEMADSILGGGYTIRQALSKLTEAPDSDWELIKARLLIRIGERL